MNPCYIITYSITDPCIVNVNSVNRTKSEDQGAIPNGRCRLYFEDGSELLLDEACDAYENKKQYCNPSHPQDLPVYG